MFKIFVSDPILAFWHQRAAISWQSHQAILRLSSRIDDDYFEDAESGWIRSHLCPKESSERFCPARELAGVRASFPAWTSVSIYGYFIYE